MDRAAHPKVREAGAGEALMANGWERGRGNSSGEVIAGRRIKGWI